jgi:hypothetical protein
MSLLPAYNAHEDGTYGVTSNVGKYNSKAGK